jgi:hypothetical protein
LFLEATSITARLAALVVQVPAQTVASLRGHVLALCAQMLPCEVLPVELVGQQEVVVLLE